MRMQTLTRCAALAALVAGLACAGNSARTDDTAVKADTSAAGNASGYEGMDRDTTMAAPSDSATDQTQSGVTDTKTGESTLGPGATQTRPDENQPVTAKGDTVGVVGDSTGAVVGDSTGHMGNADSTAVTDSISR